MVLSTRGELALEHQVLDEVTDHRCLAWRGDDHQSFCAGLSRFAGNQFYPGRIHDGE
jgi:hypothetical protein